MEIAEGEIFKKQDYESEKYRNEAASLNPQYYTLKGAEELEKCRDLYSANFITCSKFLTCNFCAANSGCGWCNEKKLCVPVDLNSRNEEFEPLCQGDCIRVLKIEFCYKGLFEPENTQGEVNFGNYPEVMNSAQNDENENNQDIFEKTLEKNFYELRSNNSGVRFKQVKSDPQSAPLSNLSDIKTSPNDSSLNYLPNSTTNKPFSVDLDTHHEQLHKDLTSISKQVFYDLLGEKINKDKKAPSLLIKPNLKTNKKEEMLTALKEFIPNFEFPQYLNSDLENSIDKIKKEKLLLWLRGYSLNEPISKKHLPIYENLNFDNEEQTRKMFLDKFYKNIVKDPYEMINTKVYKNLVGEENLFGEKINNTHGVVVPVSSVTGTGNVNIVKRFTQPLAVDKYENKSHELINRNQSLHDLIKSNKVINSKFIEEQNLKNLIKQNNMRFRQKKEKSLDDIKNELKDFLKKLN